MNLPERFEDLKKKNILREIPKTRFMDFDLLYENERTFAWQKFASLLLILFTGLFTLARIACLLHLCVKTSRFDYSI